MGEKPFSKKWFEEEAESSKMRTPSRRASILGLFNLRRQQGGSVSDVKKSANKRRSDLLKRSISAVSGSDSDEFDTPQLDIIEEKQSAKKAKWILGIDSPTLQICEGNKRTGAMRNLESITESNFDQSADAADMAPLINYNEFNEEYEGSVVQEGSSTELPTISEDSASFVTPQETLSFPYSKLKPSSGRPLKDSPLALFGRSFSSIRLRPNKNHSTTVHPTVRSVGSVQEEASSDVQSAEVVENDRNTPTGRPPYSKNRQQINRGCSKSRITKMASVIMKGFATKPPNKLRARSRHHSRPARQSKHNSAGRLNEFKGVVNIVEKDVDLENANEHLYDAIACDISSCGAPLSEVSEVILRKVGDKVTAELDAELRHSKKVFILGSGDFSACKYVIFVVGGYSNNNDGKMWQEVRFAYFNLINEAVQHRHIESLLLPYLFTGESSLAQNEIAHTALTAIVLVFLQSGFAKLKKLDLGGANDNGELRSCYTIQMDLVVGSMLHDSEGKNMFPNDMERVSSSLDVSDGCSSSRSTESNANACYSSTSSCFQSAEEVHI